MKQVLGYYLLLINAIGLLIMCIDKLLAKKQARRVPERTLLWIAALGASGAFLACCLRTTRRASPSFISPSRSFLRCKPPLRGGTT